MSLRHQPAFLRLYPLLPHRLLNRAARAITRLRRPRWLVDAAIGAWVRSDGIDLEECEPEPYATLLDLFLRRLRPGARPLGPGFVAPVDGEVMGVGVIDATSTVEVKGQRLSLARLVDGGRHRHDLAPFAGGTCLSLFLSPRGYHRVHQPVDGELVAAAWIPGRFFPQNHVALRTIPRVYERNERVVVRCRSEGGQPYLLVLVGASLVGGIHLEGCADHRLRRLEPTTLGRRVRQGDEIAHFAFGSTVVLLLPAAAGAPQVGLGDQVRLGTTLFT